MSKIQNALKHAEEYRASKTHSAADLPHGGAPTPETLDDEVNRLEASLSTWRARPAEPAPAAASAEPRHGSTAQAGGPWGEEIRRCQETLAACEARIARSQQQRSSAQAQVAEQERVVAQAAAHLATLQQRLREAEAEVQQMEGERTTHSDRLSTLRQCQALAQAAEEAEQRLQMNAEIVVHITGVQQRITEKLSQHQRASQELRESADTLRRQLADMIARAPSIGSSPMNRIDGDGRHE